MKMQIKNAHIFFLLLSLVLGSNAFSQTEDFLYTEMRIDSNGDTLLVSYAREIPIKLSKKAAKKVSAQYREQQRLQKYVKKVYPYALLASQKLKEYEKDLAAAKNDYERRKIMKKVEKALVDQYGDELKNLTINQGKILLKLIDRETGHSSYELVSEMRGSFPAACWQGLASLFGQNLKSTYDAYGEDKDIEQIVKKIQRGQI
ncbi:MAG: DUF4294 domain-containing protein [Bacteroidetes bacterium]|nr:DUF4294 domain-containing protein [Bacteroidota bacterium]